MNFLTDKKTILVGALSLLGGVSVSMLANQQSSAVPFFTQSGGTVHVIANASHGVTQKSYILQGGSSNALISAIEKVGASVSKEFPIIGAVSALLTGEQVDLLAANNITITSDKEIRVTGYGDLVDNLNDSISLVKKSVINTHITTQTNANALHQMGVTGQGVTVAVLDSGTLMGDTIGRDIKLNVAGNRKILRKYNAINGITNESFNDDQQGHGTHITSIIASRLQDEEGNYNGMAPNAHLVSVKAFDEDGNGSYSNVLDGLNWIYANRTRFRIRVLNLSLGAEVKTNYWNDPINQAVMRLWDAGIVVVTSAGNSGSDKGTITAPGNVPYIITVGGVTDSYSPGDYSDDRMLSFSSQGPTHEGFVKPEIVTYGGHIEMKMNKSLLGEKLWSSSLKGENYYAESGTSQAAAVVTGIVALMLDDDSSLSPDDVKCRLMASATPVNDPATNTNYSPFAQGSGLANAYNAVMSNATDCANRGLNIHNDLAGIQHFAGPVSVDEKGELHIDFGNGNVVAEGSVWGGGSLEGSVWGGGSLEGSVWGGGSLEGSVWGGGSLEGSVWGGGTMLEGSVWGGGTNLEGSIWGGDADLEGSVWGGGKLEGSVWGEGAVLEGSYWDGDIELEGFDHDSEAGLE